MAAQPAGPIRVLLGIAPKKAFASALDWPGLARSGRDGADALAALAAAMPRYGAIAEAAEAAEAAAAARVAGVAFNPRAPLVVAEEIPGDAGTAFGVPSLVATLDRVPTAAADGIRLAALVEACWDALHAAVAAAPAELRKGPRGGGRDRDTVVAHVIDAEAAYAAVMGLRHKPVDPAAVAAMREDRAAPG